MNNREIMLKLLKETVNFYTTNSRSVAPIGHSCYYLSANGCRCAFGRLLTPSELQLVHDKYEFKSLRQIFENEPYIQARIGMKIEFLEQLQFLHDESKNWATTWKGLSPQGLAFVNKIANDISTGKFDGITN